MGFLQPQKLMEIMNIFGNDKFFDVSRVILVLTFERFDMCVQVATRLVLCMSVVDYRGHFIH